MLQASIFGLKIVYSSFDASVVANAQLCPWVGTVEHLKSVAMYTPSQTWEPMKITTVSLYIDGGYPKTAEIYEI